MTRAERSHALALLVADTFRQARASRVAWLMLGVSVVCVLVCLSLRVENGGSLVPAGEIELYGSDDKPLTEPGMRPGRLSLAFGAVRLGLFRDGEAEVDFLRVVLAKWIAGAAGTLLALVWTAGFLPESLRPEAAAVLVSKPVPRPLLLLGKYLGVLAFVAAQAGFFVVGTWTALGLSTGDWRAGYLWSLPLLLLHFAIVYSASALLAILTRNTIASAFGSVVFWLACMLANQGHQVSALPASPDGLEPYPPAFRFAVEAGYWLLPKPADLVSMLDRSLGADRHFTSSLAATATAPALAVLSSVAFAAALLGIAAVEFREVDY